jgi:hypothetical protein
VFSVDFLLRGVLAPAVTAFVVALVAMRLSRGSRGTGAVAYAAGQVLGTAWFLCGTGDWWPTRNLQWVPWVGIAAAAIGPMVVATGLATIERWVLALLTALFAAFVLVPHWPDLWPPRVMSIALFVVATFTIHRLTDHLALRTSPRIMTISMAATALVAALLIAATFSLSVGESALMTAAALGGTAIALLLREDATVVRGLCLPYVLTISGWCYVATIEPTPPLVPLLFLPAAPLVLWITAVGPISRWSSRGRWIISAFLLALTLLGIGAWTWFSTDHGDDEYAMPSQEFFSFGGAELSTTGV